MAPPADLVAHLGDRQKHVLAFWDELSEEQQEAFRKQILAVDVGVMEAAFEASASLRVPSPSDLTPIPDDHHVVGGDLPKEERQRLVDLGLAAISRGEVAALVLAGGQASRLGSDKPKGTIPLGLNLTAHDSLLCLQAGKLGRLQRLAASFYPENISKIPWLVMTSSSTEEPTKEHLASVVKDNGLSQEQVTVFSQENIPAFDMEGRFILAQKHALATAPNGNGGLYSALAHHIDKLIAAGVKYIHVYCVDNILVKVADPLMVGIAVDKQADCIAKTVKRVEAGEKVGVVCRDRGVPTVVEYSELGELASRALPDGRLEYRAGNIANHFFSTAFLKDFITPTFHLPYHRALKKIPYVDTDGTTVKPTANNGIKLEQFVFDVFPRSKVFYVLEVQREEEFSPLKNPDSAGSECLSTCRRDLLALHTGWLRKAGASFKNGLEIKVKPSRSYDGESLEEYANGTVPVPEDGAIS